MYFILPNIIIPMYIQQLREIIPPPSQNTLRLYNQIILLDLYYVSSRLITLLKVIDSSTQFSDIRILTVCF
jgi:hypothetical protein